VAVAEPSWGRRDWALWVRPRALEGRPEGVIFAGLCILSLALIAAGRGSAFRFALPLAEMQSAASA